MNPFTATGWGHLILNLDQHTHGDADGSEASEVYMCTGQNGRTLRHHMLLR